VAPSGLYARLCHAFLVHFEPLATARKPFPNATKNNSRQFGVDSIRRQTRLVLLTVDHRRYILITLSVHRCVERDGRVGVSHSVARLPL